MKYDAYSPTPTADGKMTLYVGEPGDLKIEKNIGDVFLMNSFFLKYCVAEL